MILTDILENSVTNYPDRKALTMKMGYRTVSLRYKEVFELSQKIAVLMQKKGLEPGDKILLLAPNSPYWACIYWASILAGTILVPLNTQSTPEMIARVAEQTKAKFIFKSIFYKHELPKDLEVQELEFLAEDVKDVSTDNFQRHHPQPQDVFQILYTSGTTSAPKGVMLTHENITSNLSALKSITKLPKQNTFLSILPLSHILEQTAGFMIPFSAGYSIVYAHSPAAIMELLQEHKVTTMVGVPEFLKLVMNKIEAKAKELGKETSLRWTRSISKILKIKILRRLLFRSVLKKLGGKFHTVICGGAYLDPLLEQKWNDFGVDLLQGYGLTETSPIISTNTYTHHAFGSVGRVLPNIDFRLQEKEIQVKGPNVFQGYFENEEKTEEAFTNDGYFKTGDLGEMDKNGFLFFKGRRKYVIIGPGGQNVFPEDIEFELNKITGVLESCVVGLEKSFGHVEIHASLILDSESAPLEEIIAEANSHLASYQQITGWSLWPENDFPRSLTKKIQKTKVIEHIQSQQEGSQQALPKRITDPLIHLLADITNHPAENISGESNLVRDLGLDSLLRIELVAQVEGKFGVALEEMHITAETTVQTLKHMIEKATPVGKRKRFSFWALSWWTKPIRWCFRYLLLFPFYKIFVRLQVEGLENLQEGKLPSIFMPNHLSYVDSLIVLMALPRNIRKRISFAAALDVLYKEFRATAWLAQLVFNSFPFPRKEEDNIKPGLENMGKMLDNNHSVVIFPEGKMSQDGNLLPLKKGAGFVAIEMGTSVVPIKITGIAEVVPYCKLLPRKRRTVTVKFGKPMQFSRRDSYIEVTQKIENVMKSM